MKFMARVILILLLAVVIISVTILAGVPPVSKDALIHHLAVPKLYLSHGGIYEIPSISFSYYPMNLEMLYAIPLYFGNDILPKYIHFSFALLTALLIYYYLKEKLSITFALLGSLFFLSIPIIVKLSITVYVDLGLIFFSAASLICLLKWSENSYGSRLFIVSCVCCGFALGTKYNGLITLLILSFFVPFLYLKKIEQDTGSRNLSRNIDANNALTARVQVKALGYGILFISIALLIFSPWMIRNIKWTGNPVYPLFNSVFIQNKTIEKKTSILKPGKKIEKHAADTLEIKGPFAIRKHIYKEAWWQTALIPIRVFFMGQDGSPVTFDGKLNPFLCILPLFAFFRDKGESLQLRREKKVFLIFSFLYFFIVFFYIDMRIRWIAPIIPPLVILSMFGLHNIIRVVKSGFPLKGKNIFSGSMAILIFFIFLTNLFYITKQFKYVAPLSYISGKLDRDRYIERFRPEYPVIQYANKNLPKDAKICCVFLGMRRYYSSRELVFFSSSEFFNIVKKAESSKEIQDELLKRGMTHVIVGYDLLNGWGNLNLDSGQKTILTQFFRKQISLLFANSKYGLYALH